MKFSRKTIVAFILGIIVLPGIVFAQLTVPQGGTGLDSIANGSILFKESGSLRLATSSELQFDSSSGTLTVTNASTTALSMGNVSSAEFGYLNGVTSALQTQLDAKQGTLGNNDITPDMVLSTGQTDEYVLTYEATGDTWEWAAASAASFSDIDTDYGAETVTSIWTLSGNWVNTANPWADNEVSNTLTIGSSGSVDDGALSANVSLLGSTIAANELASADFGDFTCNGTTCSLDASYLTGNETITLSGDVTGSGATSITTALSTGSVADNEIDYTAVTLNDLTFDVGSVSKTEFGYLNGVTSALQTQLNSKLETVDISDDTNLVGGTGITLTGDTLSNDFGADIGPTEMANTTFGDFQCSGTTCILVANIIEAADIANDTVTNAQIADADQATTMCIYIEDPTADDDLNSIWSNKTTNDFLLTELWAESDQTVNLDLQVDDGTPADVNGTDISPAAGEAEDTSLSGDTTVAAGEELDLAITSVSGTPTWVSICWTGNWVD